MTVDLDRRIALSPHAALKTRAEREFLVLPERGIRVGGSGGEILRLCSEGRSGHDIVTSMQARYPDAPGITTQVVAFLDEMLELDGLVIESRKASKVRT
jgi:hypothetical protein